MLVFAGHAEQMALVVVQHLAVRTRPEQAVAMAAVGELDDQAAGDHRAKAPGLLQQPGMGRPQFGLGLLGRSHAETRGEHLREDHQVGTGGALQQGGEMLAVGLGVVPDQGGLDQGDVQVRQNRQIAHSFSAA